MDDSDLDACPRSISAIRVWTVRYNRCHDQLLLSGGTDSLVNLWRVSSISSAPLLEMEDPSGWVRPADTHPPTTNLEIGPH